MATGMQKTALMTNNRASSKIAHSCPFCGGPGELVDDEIIAPCGNCGSMLRLLPSTGIKSYLISANLPQREALFFLNRELKHTKQPLVKRRGETYQLYLPFYHIRGKVFDYRKQIIEHKRVSLSGTGEGAAAIHEYTTNSEQQNALIKPWELSVAGFDSLLYGIDSLGIRTSVLKLAPLTPQKVNDKVFYRCDRDISYARHRSDKTVNRRSLVSEGKSLARYTKALYPEVKLVYLPIWIINFESNQGRFYAVIDNVAKRVVKIEEGELLADNNSHNTDNGGNQFEMIAHRCDYCGFDLPKQKSGELFICANCGRSYRADKRYYRQITMNVPRMTISREAVMFPFWMFVLGPSDDNQQLKQALKLESDTLFVPAFQIRNLKRAAKLSLSYSQIIDRIDFDKLEENCYPVQEAVLDRSEAERMILPLLLAGRDYIEHLDLESLF
jgi:predicted RNA-binding Zn-ribbon protein involved in translation (DUF1610 family)